jgi:hypothetical protein
MEFCISQKSGKEFSIELQTPKGIEKLQKTNRFYVSKSGGIITKRNVITNKRIGLIVGKLVGVLNTYDSTVPFTDYDIDLPFYESEVMKIVDAIEPKQFSLFDMSTMLRGKKTKMLAPSASVKINSMDTLLETGAGLNTLGKNQRMKQIDTIVGRKGTVKGISGRYTVVIDFDVKSMSATLYCLSKGSLTTLAVDKKAYDANNLFGGQLIFCESFKKNKNNHTLTGFKVVEDFDLDEKRMM